MRVKGAGIHAVVEAVGQIGLSTKAQTDVRATLGPIVEPAAQHLLRVVRFVGKATVELAEAIGAQRIQFGTK